MAFLHETLLDLGADGCPGTAPERQFSRCAVVPYCCGAQIVDDARTLLPPYAGNGCVLYCLTARISRGAELVVAADFVQRKRDRGGSAYNKADALRYQSVTIPSCTDM